MKSSNLIKSSLWLAGMLIIGALGSGLWEVALKPGLHWLGNALLDIGTLGLASLRDAIYVEIARGSYERASEKTYAMLSGGLCAAIGISTVVLIVARKKEQKSQRILGLLRYQKFIILFGFAIFAFLPVQTARLIYINRAANHIEQIQRIVAPYISAEQRVTYASRVAQMYTREQYVNLLSDLTIVAKKNNVYVPSFDIY